MSSVSSEPTLQALKRPKRVIPKRVAVIRDPLQVDSRRRYDAKRRIICNNAICVKYRLKAEENKKHGRKITTVGRPRKCICGAPRVRPVTAVSKGEFEKSEVYTMSISRIEKSYRDDDNWQLEETHRLEAKENKKRSRKVTTGGRPRECTCGAPQRRPVTAVSEDEFEESESDESVNMSVSESDNDVNQQLVETDVATIARKSEETQKVIYFDLS